MNKILLAVGIIVMIIALGIIVNASISNQEYYLYHMHYENGEFTIIDKTLATGYFAQQTDNIYDYKLEVISEDNSAYSTYFDPTILYSDGFENNQIIGGMVKLSKTDFFISTPKSSDKDKIIILKNNEKVFEENEKPKPCRIT
jgi:hypothetical protein